MRVFFWVQHRGESCHHLHARGTNGGDAPNCQHLWGRIRDQVLMNKYSIIVLTLRPSLQEVPKAEDISEEEEEEGEQ